MTVPTRRSLATCFTVVATACGTPDAGPAESPAATVDSAAPASRAAADPASYRAVGTEPFWGLDISSAGLRFSTPDNIDGVRFPPARPVAAGDTLGWRSERNGTAIEARLWPERCSDGMSDRTWTYAASVGIGETTYRGCADPAPGLARAALPVGAWIIAGHRSPGASALSGEAAERMHGRAIVFDSARAVSDTMVCADAAYRYLTVSADSMLAEFRTTPAAAGLDDTPGGFLGVTEVRCSDSAWAAPGGLLLWADDERPLLVWDGVFYDLAAHRSE